MTGQRIQVKEAPDSHPSAARRPSLPSMPACWVSFSTRVLESWLMWAVAAASAVAAWWLAPMMALVCAMAAGGGLWSSRRPARHQAAVALRGSLLVASVLAVQSTVPSPEAMPILHLWPGVLALAYAFLLQPAWAAGLAGFALLGALPAHWLQGQAGVPWVEAALAVSALVSARAGAMLRRADLGRVASWRDDATGLFSRSGLVTFGDDLLQGGRNAGRPCAMALFDCADLLEVRSVYGPRVGRALLRQLVGKLTLLAGRRGLVARTGPTQFAVLLPGCDQEEALGAIRSVLGHPSRIEYDSSDTEIVLVPGFAVETITAEVEDCRELYELLDGRLARVRDSEQRRQRRMRRSRERQGSSSLPAMESQPPRDQGAAPFSLPMPSPLAAPS